MKEVAHITQVRSFKSILSDYGQLLKLRLTITVVLSSVFGFLLAPATFVDWTALFALIGGGFLVVASANGINQIIEKDQDKLMTRTQNRPLATGRISPMEAGIFCSITGIIGIYILGSTLNFNSALLGAISLLSYSFIYTPLKKVSSFAVFIGAIPGAIPPMLGWVAVTGEIGVEAFALFTLQFMWQFPHFWAIAWLLDDDYKLAGYRLLPTSQGRSPKAATYNIWYSFVLAPLGLLPYFLGISGIISGVVAVLGALFLTSQSIKLHNSLEMKDAKRLMFYSIVYNPVVFLAFTIDKI